MHRTAALAELANVCWEGVNWRVVRPSRITSKLSLAAQHITGSPIWIDNQAIRGNTCDGCECVVLCVKLVEFTNPSQDSKSRRFVVIRSRCATMVLCCLLISACNQSGKRSAPSPPQGSSPKKDLLRPDTSFALKVIAVTGEPIGNEKAKNKRFLRFALNNQGRLAFLVEKDSSRFQAVDLYVSQGENTRLLMRQRPRGPFSTRTVLELDDFELNNRGQLLVYGVPRPPGTGPVGTRQESYPTLWFCDGTSIREVAQLPSFGGADGFDLGDNSTVVYGTRTSERGSHIVAVRFPGQERQIVAYAASDPSTPAGDFSGFRELLQVNASHQVLFSANRGQGNELLVLRSPPKGGQEAVFRQVARRNSILPGLERKLIGFTGHPPFKNVVLNDRGEILMTAQTEPARGAATPEVGAIQESLLLFRNRGWLEVSIAGRQGGDGADLVSDISRGSLNQNGQVAFIASQKGQKILYRQDPDGTRHVLVRPDQRLSAIGLILRLRVTTFPTMAPALSDCGNCAVPVLLAPRQADDSSLLPSHPASKQKAIVLADKRKILEVFRFSTLIRGSQSRNLADPWKLPLQTNSLGQVAFVVELSDRRQALCLCVPE